MTHRWFITVAIACIALAGIGGPANGAATPDVPFLADLIKLQPQVATAMRRAHSRLDDPAVRQTVDDNYDDLVDIVNGFLESLAVDVATNKMHPDQWSASANDIMARAKAFNASIAALQKSRRQATPPPGTVFGTRGGPAKGTTFEIPLVDITTALQNAQKIRVEGQAFDDKQRADFAATVRQQKWPARCALGLSDVAPCPTAVPSATRPPEPHRSP